MVLFLACTCALGSAIPSYTPDNFQYTGTIRGPLRHGVLYQVHLEAPVLEKCAAGCRDLRVFHNGKEIPYVVIENRNDGRSPSIYPLEITELDEQGSVTTLIMKMPQKYEPITRLTLDMPDRDFRKNVTLEGSNDLKTWAVVVNDRIYDFTAQVDLRKTHVSFPPADFRYYRLTLRDETQHVSGEETLTLKYQGLDFSVHGRETKKLRISRVMGQTFSETEASAIYDETNMTAYRIEQDKDRNTVIAFETGIPFTRVSFDVSNPYFYRKVAIYSSDTGKENTYKLLQSSSLYRLLFADITEAKSHLDCGTAGNKYYRIVIENRSNPQLEINGVRLGWVQKHLFFVALSDAASYTAGFGNAAIGTPDYDLSTSINRTNWQKVSSDKSEITGITQNPNYTPGLPQDAGKKTEKTVLIVVVCLLVAGISFWLYTLLSKTERK
jgi:hypothetical protein